MKQRYNLLIILLTVLLSNSTIAQYPHAEPPQNDPSLTNRFGRSWSKPIYTGYLIAEGKYIEAPYIVEQRGYRTMVNGVQVDRLDPRSVLPLPPPPAVTSDPGIPDDLTKENTVSDAVKHPITVAQRRYWDYLGLKGDERLRKEKAYFSSLPCIAQVEDTEYTVHSGFTGAAGARKIILHDYTGESLISMFRLSPTPPKVQLSDKVLYKYSKQERHSCENSLRSGSIIFSNYGVTGAIHPRPDSLSRWKNIFKTMASDLLPKDKLRKLKALGFLSKSDTIRSANNFFSIDNFTPTEQLWKRLENDKLWKEGSEKRLYAITNGWQYIEPAFSRTNIKETISPDVVRPMTKSSKIKDTSPAKSKIPTKKQKVITNATPSTNDAKNIPNHTTPMATIFLLLFITILIVIIIFIIKQRKK